MHTIWFHASLLSLKQTSFLNKEDDDFLKVELIYFGDLVRSYYLCY